MPELPDVSLYCNALSRELVGRRIEGVVVKSPFLIRSFEPPIEDIVAREVEAVDHIGKRIRIKLDPELYIVIHLMIAGRFQWKEAGKKPTTKRDLMAIAFEHGTLMITEAGHKHRASLHLEQCLEDSLAHDPGGIDIMTCSYEAFEAGLTKENRTLKRALTNARIFSGIGNAYSDEILLRARLSPIKWTSKLDADERKRLFEATQEVMNEWIERLLSQAGSKFPSKVTAFRPEMGAHGKFGQPCPQCGSPIQRIVYADNETNYCATCQNNGKVLADRSLSRLLKDDWPRDIESWEK